MKIIFAVILLCLSATSAYARTAPFQLSLVPDVAIHSRNTHISGIALSVWGENPQSALALGIVNGSRGNSLGLSLGFVNYASNYKGLEWGTVNVVSGTLTGVQSGFVNYAENLAGLQLGAVNVAKRSRAGIQIGFINLLLQNIWFTELPRALAPGMIFVNWRF